MSDRKCLLGNYLLSQNPFYVINLQIDGRDVNLWIYISLCSLFTLSEATLVPNV